MKELQDVMNRTRPISASAGIILVTALAVAFWFATTPAGLAADKAGKPVVPGLPPAATCVICHKKATTLTLTCPGAEYQGHIDHGDMVGACHISPVGAGPK